VRRGISKTTYVAGHGRQVMEHETSAQRSKQMSRIRSKDTKPELLVRQLVHGMGYRYRLHRRDLPGSPDLVFPSRHKVILVHGCFWHRHPDPQCPLTRTPKSRLDFWVPKFEANRQRDLENEARLGALGWGILVVWECQLRHLAIVEVRVREFLEG
jgi:DNA mismatch endonuclease (patch repair protein)